MEGISWSFGGSQLVVGDFNVISRASEKEGGLATNIRNMEEFNQAIFNWGLSYVDFDDSTFTLTNGVVRQCLDRALINAQWAEAYSLTRVSHMSRGKLDHAPLIVRCNLGQTRKTSFSYHNVWHRHSDFIVIVRETWQIPVEGSSLYAVSPKGNLNCQVS